MAEERLDYAVLISLSMREEAEVMASALRAEGIDAFIGNLHHATWDWGHVIALGGLQVLVPRQKLAEARQVIRERISEAAANPEGEPVGRRDRWKAWAVIGYSFVFPVTFSLLAMWFYGEEEYLPPPAEMLTDERVYFSVPSDLSEAEAQAIVRDYCRDNPRDAVISREDGMGYITPCEDVLRMGD